MSSGAAQIAGDAGATTARFRLECWGDFTITDIQRQTDVTPRGRKARALLAYLALHRHKRVSRERLIGLLWGDHSEEKARASLRQVIFQLKRLSSGPDRLLAIDRDHLVMDAAMLTTEIDELRLFAKNGDIDRLLEAVPDYDDRLFADLDDVDPDFQEWLTIERTRQQDALLVLLRDSSDAATIDGRIRQARALHRRLTELDPLRGAPKPPPLPAKAEQETRRLPIAVPLPPETLFDPLGDPSRPDGSIRLAAFEIEPPRTGHRLIKGVPSARASVKRRSIVAIVILAVGFSVLAGWAWLDRHPPRQGAPASICPERMAGFVRDKPFRHPFAASGRRSARLPTISPNENEEPGARPGSRRDSGKRSARQLAAPLAASSMTLATAAGFET